MIELSEFNLTNIDQQLNELNYIDERGMSFSELRSFQMGKYGAGAGEATLKSLIKFVAKKAAGGVGGAVVDVVWPTKLGTGDDRSNREYHLEQQRQRRREEAEERKRQRELEELLASTENQEGGVLVYPVRNWDQRRGK